MRLFHPFLFLALFSLNQPVWAKQLDPDLPPLDAADHSNLVDSTSKRPSGACLKRPGSPLCPVELWIMAHLRGDSHWWDLAYIKGQAPDYQFTKGSGTYALYRILASERVEPGWKERSFSSLVDRHCGKLRHEAKYGDIRIDVQIKYETGHPDEKRILYDDDAPSIFILRKIPGNIWKIFDECGAAIYTDDDAVYWGIQH